MKPGYNTFVNSDLRLTEKLLRQMSRSLVNHASAVQFSQQLWSNGSVEMDVPELVILCSTIKQRLFRAPRFVIVEGLRLLQYEPCLRDLLFVLLASGIGTPSATDSSGTIIWNVTPAPNPAAGYHATITEHSLAASLHTDSSYKSEPEDFVALLAVRPATVGGETHVLESSRLLSRLDKSRSGKDCLQVLSSEQYPFRVPDAFTRNRSRLDPEWIVASILSDGERLRFRYDTIVDGLSCWTAVSPEALWALNYFYEALTLSERYVFKLRAGDILFLNNRSVLHGRSAFSDGSRLLLRIRLAGGKTGSPGETNPASSLGRD